MARPDPTESRGHISATVIRLYGHKSERLLASGHAYAVLAGMGLTFGVSGETRYDVASFGAKDGGVTLGVLIQ